MKPYQTIKQNHLLLLFILVLGALLLYFSWMIIDGILGAIIFYTIFRPLHIYFTEKKGWSGGLSAIAIILVSFLVLILPFFVLSSLVINKILYYQTNPNELGILKEKIWPIIQTYISDEKNLDVIISQIQSKLYMVFSNTLNLVTTVLLQLSVLYFLLYFMLKEHVKLEEVAYNYIPLKRFQIQRLGTELNNITNSNLLGQGFICFVQGSLVTIGFLIFGLNDPFFYGVVCFFLSFIPFVGAPLVFVPAGILQYYSGDHLGGIGIILWGFILVTNIDNVIRFYLSKKIGDVHPLITIIGVIIGIPTFGILGLVYGPLLISYFILLVKIWDEANKRLAHR